MLRLDDVLLRLSFALARRIASVIKSAFIHPPLRSSLAVGGKQRSGNAPALRRHGQHARLRSHSSDAGALTAWGLPTRNAP